MQALSDTLCTKYQYMLCTGSLAYLQACSDMLCTDRYLSSSTSGTHSDRRAQVGRYLRAPGRNTVPMQWLFRQANTGEWSSACGRGRAVPAGARKPSRRAACSQATFATHKRLLDR